MPHVSACTWVRKGCEETEYTWVLTPNNFIRTKQVLKQTKTTCQNRLSSGHLQFFLKTCLELVFLYENILPFVNFANFTSNKVCDIKWIMVSTQLAFTPPRWPFSSLSLWHSSLRIQFILWQISSCLAKKFKVRDSKILTKAIIKTETWEA